MPPRMDPRALTRWRRRCSWLALAASLVPRASLAQVVPDAPYELGSGRVTFSSEITGIVGPRDTEAFFNYTDYEHNAMRLARVRLLGEWRIQPRLSLLGELRTENADTIQASALYLRWQPFASGNFDIQAGRIPPVVGTFPRRAYGRDNPLIGTPLAYQYLTSLRPDALPETVNDVLRMRGRGWDSSFPLGSRVPGPGVPLFSSFRWDTGVEAHWQRDWLEVAGAYTLGSPAVPTVHETNDGREWSGRAAVHLPFGVTAGVSGARGQWIASSALRQVPLERRSESMQTLVGADLEYGWLHWLVRGEYLRSVFHVPMPGMPEPTPALAAWSGYLEARYRLTPRWQVATRVERLRFASVLATPTSTPVPWDAPVDRIEGDVGFRVLRNLEVRAGWQQNWRDGGRVRERGFPALEALYWF